MSIPLNVRWRVLRLWVRESFAGLENIVTDAEWELVVSLGNAEVKNYGVSHFSVPTGVFMNFNDLTNEQVVSWIQAEVGESKINSWVTQSANQLAYEMGSTSTVEVSLPWV